MKTIVGLGNPGRKYAGTRHNVGFMVLDRLARLHFARFRKSFIDSAYIAKVKKDDKDILLVKPAVFMNNSGVCLMKIVSRYNINLSDILVIYDDADLNLGKVRFRTKGRSAGHKGIDSAIHYLGTSSIYRIRIGIGKPGDGRELSDYVLSDFTYEEREILDKVIDKVCLCGWNWIDKSTDFVTRECN